MTSRTKRDTQNAQEVKASAAKGRPMLTWVGKRPVGTILARPAQHMETFDPTSELAQPPADIDNWHDWPSAYPKGGLLFYGDNKEVLASLIANGFRGKVNLIYIDPPFDSGADYVRRVQLRGASGLATLEGEGQSLIEQVQYTDIWANDNYLQFMYERLQLLAELLAPNGSLYLHCDYNRSHLLRCILDEVFGADAFRGEIVWQRNTAHNNPVRYGPIHDTIYYYAKGDEVTWNVQYTPYNAHYIESQFVGSTEGGGSPPGNRGQAAQATSRSQRGRRPRRLTGGGGTL